MEHVDMHTSLASQAHSIYDWISTLANIQHLMGGRVVLASGHMLAKYLFSCGPMHGEAKFCAVIPLCPSSRHCGML